MCFTLQLMGSAILGVEYFMYNLTNNGLTNIWHDTLRSMMILPHYIYVYMNQIKNIKSISN